VANDELDRNRLDSTFAEGGGEDTMGGPTMSRHAVLAGFVLLGLALTTPAHTAETPLGAATVTFVVS